jgi:hypothetical protein
MGVVYRESFQLPEGVHGDLPAERAFLEECSNTLADWHEALPGAARESTRQFEVRCPTKGCLVGETYRIDIYNVLSGWGGQRFLFYSRTSRGVRAHILNWAFSDDWGAPVWYPVSCRHGNGKLERGWLLDIGTLLLGAHGPTQTLEETWASAPEEIRKGRARRVFHPKQEAWNGKR